jgi:hypothetical protein
VGLQSLKMCFPDYDGPDGEAPPAVEFIQKKYREVSCHNHEPINPALTQE